MKLQTASITNANAPEVVAAGRAAMQGGDWVVDFTSVVHCDTSAVACILAWLRFARASGGKLQLLGLPADLLSLAKLYGVEALIAAP